MVFFGKKNNPSGKYKDQKLHGNILNTDFTYQCGYAVRNGLFPADNWTVVLYNKAIDVHNIKINTNYDIENFPSIYFVIKKDPDNKLYDINIWGAAAPGRKGTIVTAWLNKDSAVVFEKGELDITEVDKEKGIIETRIWAVTKDGKNEINGRFTISIADSLINPYNIDPSPRVNIDLTEIEHDLMEPGQEMVMNDFDRLFKRIPSGFRCRTTFEDFDTKIKTEYILLGIPPYPEHGYYPLEEMPANAEGIAFWGLPNQEEILEAFIQTEYAKKIRALSFGCSSECPNFDLGHYLRANLNYQNQVAILSKGFFPNIKALSLGEWFLNCNSSDVHGHLGDISVLLERCEHLEELNIYGHFELSRPLNLKDLKKLEVITEGNCDVGLEPISQKTFENLISQPLPKIESIWLSLKCWEKRHYIFPESFLSGQNTPNIKGVELDAGVFLPTEQEHFKNSALAKTPGLRLYFDDVEE